MHNIPADQDVRYSSLPGETTTHPCFALSSDYVPFKPGSDLGIGLGAAIESLDCGVIMPVERV